MAHCTRDGDGGTLRRRRLFHQQSPQQTSRREGVSVQRAVFDVPTWRSSNKTVLNSDKCDADFFNTNYRKANWQPSIIAKNTHLLHHPQPKSFEVTLDRLLTFETHTQSTHTKATARYRNGGLRKDQQTKIYKTLQLSLLTYATPVWQPSSSAFRIEPK